MLEVGKKAPAIKLPDQNGDVRSLADYKGKKVLLYFYPRDNTGGCTKQAKAYTDLAADFAKAGIEIIGIRRIASLHTRGSKKSRNSVSRCFPTRNWRRSKPTMFGRKRRTTVKYRWV